MASKRGQRRKACGGKVRYESELDARRAMFGLRRASGTRDFMVSYRCEFCKMFHFGHPPPRVRQAMAAHARKKGPSMMVKDDG